MTKMGCSERQDKDDAYDDLKYISAKRNPIKFAMLR
jgi:hypothetical protein